ncbi:hypothetical protein Gohar_020413 [Gossypium harknessii]|uniref:DM2 domain-containing protein n=1 Tax=Gossypium harknessii TaxID=34285 RepID=A0A7J9I0A6_9ROSI|nr:hypothetical protein [Gossypium harknessii]
MTNTMPPLRTMEFTPLHIERSRSFLRNNDRKEWQPFLQNLPCIPNFWSSRNEFLEDGVDPDQPGFVLKSNPLSPKFLSFFKRVTNSLDQGLYPNNHIIIWGHARSPAPHEVLGIEVDTCPRTFAAIWHYVKARKLQNPNDPSFFNGDEQLQKVFGEKRLNFTVVSQNISQHLSLPPIHLNTKSIFPGIVLQELHAMMCFNQSPVEFVNALIEPQSMDLKLVAREASQSAEKLQIRILQPTMPTVTQNSFPSLIGDEEARAAIAGNILENGLLKPSEEVIDATCKLTEG